MNYLNRFLLFLSTTKKILGVSWLIQNTQRGENVLNRKFLGYGSFPNQPEYNIISFTLSHS